MNDTAENQYTPIPGVPWEVRYDVWSNIHYGYVGTEIGMDDWVLRAGANGAEPLEHPDIAHSDRSAEHPPDLQSLMRISYAVVCWTTTKKRSNDYHSTTH